MKLYEMPREYEEVWKRMSSDDDVTDEEMGLALTQIDEVFNAKVENCSKVMVQLEAASDNFAKEIARLTAKKRAADKRLVWLKGYVQENMLDMGMNQVVGDIFKVTIQKNPVSVLIEDESLIPPEYYVTPDPKVSKSSIKEAIEGGSEVPGCSLHRTESLRIR